MKDILNNKKMLYIGICVLVIGLAFAIGTYAYYSSTITGSATGQILAYTCTSNNTTSFTINDLTNMYPGYSATRTINLDATLYTNATIEVTSYTNMGTVGSSHPNLAIYNDENHQNKMSAGTNIINATITPGTTTSVPLYIYWPYEGVDTYSSDIPSASITITCNQGVDPAEIAAAKFAAGSTCVAVTSASDLHTEACSQSSNYCYADGYTANGSKGTTTITYGSIWDGTGTIPTGAAFDCDVNNNGVIDKVNGVSTERFYYVSDKWNEGTDINSFDTTTGVLIYYKNFVSGTPSDGAAAYALQADIQEAGYEVSSYDNWHGPVTAVKNLPKTTGANAWRSDLLTTRERTIYACDNADCSSTPSLSTSGGTITPNPFDYGSTTAARLLTVAEVAKGCKTLNNNTSLSNAGSLSACNFLFEGTKYANSSKATYGPWLETPFASNSVYALYAIGDTRSVSHRSVSYAIYGVRPVIEIAKTKIVH